MTATLPLMTTEQSGSAQTSQYLTFVLDEEQYAIEILAIREIVAYGRVTVVPLMPASIRGVINLRGAVVPVLDLSARFGRAPGPLTKKTCIVIVELEIDGDRRCLGVRVDGVNAVMEINAADIEPPPRMPDMARGDLLAGMARIDGRFVMILAAEKALAMDESEESLGTAPQGEPPARETVRNGEMT